MLASSPCTTGSTGRASPPMLSPDTWSVALPSVYDAVAFRPFHGSSRRLVCSESNHDCATEKVGRTSE